MVIWGTLAYVTDCIRPLVLRMRSKIDGNISIQERWITT